MSYVAEKTPQAWEGTAAPFPSLMRFSLTTNENRRGCPLVPPQSAAGLVFRHPGLEKVLLLFQVQHLAHPGEGVLDAALDLG